MSDSESSDISLLEYPEKTITPTSQRISENKTATRKSYNMAYQSNMPKSQTLLPQRTQQQKWDKMSIAELMAEFDRL